MFAKVENLQMGSELEVAWESAACRGASADGRALFAIFFSEQLNDIAAAKAICADCPVARACLKGAHERQEPWGVWGGELFVNGKVLAQKRKRGRPPKERAEQLSA